MSNVRMLSTIAATLLMSAGLASAQSPNTQAPARAPSAQQNAPAEKSAPPMQGSEQSGERKGSGTTGQSQREPKPDSAGRDQPAVKGGAQTDQRRGERDRNGRPQQKGQPSTERQSPDMKRQGETRGQRETTGQGAGGSARLSTEQRTRITSVIRQQQVAPANLSIALDVGVRVPDNVRVYPLPAEVVTVYPEWQGYLYILVGERIVIVHPRTHVIVYVLEA